MADSLQGELDLSSIADRLTQHQEFLRMWSGTKGAQAFCIIEPQNLGADPALFGMAVVDALRHAAQAWAQSVQVTPEHAFERIMEGFNAEMETPTGNAKQVPTGTVN